MTKTGFHISNRRSLLSEFELCPYHRGIIVYLEYQNVCPIIGIGSPTPFHARGSNDLLRVRGVWKPNSDALIEILALFILCGTHGSIHYSCRQLFKIWYFFMIAWKNLRQARVFKKWTILMLEHLPKKILPVLHLLCLARSTRIFSYTAISHLNKYKKYKKINISLYKQIKQIFKQLVTKWKLPSLLSFRLRV